MDKYLQPKVAPYELKLRSSTAFEAAQLNFLPGQQPVPKDGVEEDTEALPPPEEMAVPGAITVHKRRKIASINTDDS